MSARALARVGAVLRGRAADARDTATPLFPVDEYGQRGNRTCLPQHRYDPIPDDRSALRRLVEEADVISAHGRAWLLIACPPPLLDYLATFDAATEDDEDTGDGEPDNDDELGQHPPMMD